MSKIQFIYENNIFEMIIKENDTIEKLIENYCLLFTEKNDLLFIYKGINISENKKKLNILKKKRNIIISIFNKNNYKNNETIIEPENFICPECKNLAFIYINENNINVNCMKNHNNYYSFNEFIEKQYINENTIKCNICNNKKCLYGDNFYICTCNKYICQLCMINHIKNNNRHKVLDYNYRYLLCKKHLIEYISYCSHCHCNLCQLCEEDHKNHKNNIILFKKEKNKLNNKMIREKVNEINENISKINKYKEEINNIAGIFNYFIKNLIIELNNFNKICNKMLILLNNLNNYENIRNILNYRTIKKDINDFLNANINNKFKYLLHIFENYILEK